MSESHLESDNRRTPHQEQLRHWIREDEFTSYIKSNIKENLNVDRQRPPSVVSIFTVPSFLKKLKIDAYVPEIVSLGPYHHRSAELPPMNNHKGKALRRMMARFNDNRNPANDPNNMDFYNLAKEEIMKLENEIRDSYAENIDCDGKTLSLMLCLDGCLILDILMVANMVANSYTGFDILSDILKLENQIPLIVLHKLLQLVLDSTTDAVDRKLLEVLVKGTFKIYPFDYHYMKDCSWTETYKEDQHILGLLHTLIVSPPPRPNSQNNVPLPLESRIAVCLPCHPNSQDKIPRPGSNLLSDIWDRLYYMFVSADGENTREDEYKAMKEIRCIPRAVELRNAGIKFKPSDGGIRGIKFEEKNATICLPPIIITEFTEILFRNLIALEMCKAEPFAKPFEINYVAHYMAMMDQLIDSEQDVAVLREVGIVTHGIGSDEEVAEFFNGLCKGATVDVKKDVFDKLTKKVNAENARYRNKLKVQIAHLVESSPWKILVLAVATVILLLTVVQTIFSVI